MDFTVSQKEALKVLDRDTLVSAGAGSGKTRVLTERIANLISSGVNPLNLLVLTFTKNAASEMKGRVKKRLRKEENIDPKTFNLLEQADISTIDSFVMNQCKKYFYKLNIRSDINIIDSNVLSMQKNIILDEIFEELYDTKDEVFLDYITNFTEKEDSYIKEYFLKLINKVELEIDVDSFLNEAYTKYSNDKFKNLMKKGVINLLIKNLKIVDFYLEYLGHISTEDKIRNGVLDQREKLEDAIEDKSYDSLRKFILELKLPNVPKTENQLARDLKKKIKELTYYKECVSLVKDEPDLDELVSKYLLKDEYITLYVDVLKCFFNKLDKFKKDNNAYDFSDLSKKLYMLIKNDDEVRRELSSKYHYILLDEYQDTSDIQEGILKLISHNNMYMVGDIKQSIYRFRNANPDIFKGKYNTFTKRPLTGEEDLGLGYRIDMIENFRSRSEVLDDINTIFNPLMTLDYGDCDYTHGGQMVFGNHNYDLYPLLNDHHMDIFTYEMPKDELGKKIKYPYTPIEIEAFKVARDIKSKLEMGYEVIDGETYKPRKAIYSDFCIIVDRESNYETYTKIFEYCQIPLSVIQDVKMTKTDTTMVLTNMLKLINLASIKDPFENSDYVHAFMSISRSFLYQLDDNTIFNIIKNKDINNEISVNASTLNKLIDVESNSSIFLEGLNLFNFFKKIPTTSSITNKEHEAEYIYNTILSLDSLNYSFSDICTYFANCADKDLDIKYKLDHDNEIAVKLMNIHKSKGLEFPICYFIGLGKDPNTSDEDIPYFDSTYGFASLKQNTEDGEFKSLNSLFIKNKLRDERRSERLRLFYVALTRAKEKMIFVCEDFRLGSNVVVKEDMNTFRDYFAYDYIENNLAFDMYIKPFELEDLNLSNYNLINKTGKKITYNTKPVYELAEEVKPLEKSRISKTVTKPLSPSELESVDLGIRLHEIMESLDFKNLDLSILKLNSFEEKTISAILSNSIFKDISKAETYHEYEFKFIKDNEVYNGIIDLLVVYSDHIDIIDYKLSNTESSEYVRQLKIYKEFIETKSDLKINCYLLSLLKNEIKEVKF